MPNIDWYGPEKGGELSTASLVTHTTPVYEALEQSGKKIAHTAAFLLDASAKHRTGQSEIRAKRNHMDYYVYITDPLGRGAAQGIENGWTDKHGNKHDGLHPLEHAVQAAVRTSGVKR